MFVSQPTYVEKPKYMSAGRLFHSERKYQSDKTHVASTQVGHARTAADTVRYTNGPEEPGHALVVGNPLTGEMPLPTAEVEAEFVAELLSGVGFEVHALMRQAASKAAVKSKIEGAKWVHFAGHFTADRGGKKALILAQSTHLTMDEVQGSVRMGSGSTVVLSTDKSVVLARAFLFAGAAATVVSLWSVDDGSTAALMTQMYKHLEDGRTTAQALRLAMLHLLIVSRWRRPLYWAAFLVVGANTRLPSGHTPKPFDKNALMLAEEEEEEEETSSSGRKHTPKPKKGRKKTVKLGAGKR